LRLGPKGYDGWRLWCVWGWGYPLPRSSPYLELGTFISLISRRFTSDQFYTFQHLSVLRISYTHRIDFKSLGRRVDTSSYHSPDGIFCFGESLPSYAACQSTSTDRPSSILKYRDIIIKMVDCEVCSRTFGDWHAAKQHMNAVGHWECESCNAEFWTQDAAADHMNRYSHWRPEFDCEGCNAAFDTLGEAKRHMHDKGHWRQHWCSDCKRGFESEQNLKAVSMHHSFVDL